MRHLIVKAARIAEGLSRQELADYMHKSESTIKAWETPLPLGSEPANLRDVSRLLHRLNVPADIYIHCHTEFGQPIRPDHIRVIKLLDDLTPGQREALISLMEQMVKP